MLLQAEQLRQHYMTKYDSEVADAYQNLQPVLQNIKELRRKVRRKKTTDVLHLQWNNLPVTPQKYDDHYSVFNDQ